MACSNCDGCTCRVIGGSGAVVTGTGEQHDPYVVSANVGLFQAEDTDCINLDMNGSGTAGNPFVITAELNIHPSPDNVLVCDGDGLLVDCDTVVTCIGNNLGCGLEFNNGLICVMISEDDGNQLECRDDGLYVQFDCNDLGCGLTLDGDGNIAVDTGTAGDDKRGLTCNEATGVVGVDPGCGLRIALDGRLRISLDDRFTPAAQNVVGNRNLNVPVPNGVEQGAGDQPNRGVTTQTMDAAQGQAIIFTDNTGRCTQIRGYGSIIGSIDIEQFPDTDIQVTLEASVNGAPYEVLDVVWRRHIPAGANAGQPTIERVHFSREDVFTIPPGATRFNRYRMAVHRSPVLSVGGDRSGPGFQANVLAFAMTAQMLGHNNAP